MVNLNSEVILYSPSFILRFVKDFIKSRVQFLIKIVKFIFCKL